MTAAPKPMATAREELRELPIDQIQPDPRNARTIYDQAALSQLRDSIKAQGVVQPLVVRKTGDPMHPHLVVAGHRRLKAAKLAGLKTVPVVIRELTPAQAHLAQFAENHGREDLTPLEEARHFKRHLDATKISQAELAKALGVAPSVISDALAMLALPPALDRLFEGPHALSASHGRELARLAGHKDQLAYTVKWLETRTRDWRGAWREMPAKDLRAFVNERLAMLKRRAARAAKKAKGEGGKKTSGSGQTPQQAYAAQAARDQKAEQELDAAIAKVIKRDAPKYATQVRGGAAYKTIEKWPAVMVAALIGDGNLDLGWWLDDFEQAVVKAIGGRRSVAQLALWYRWGDGRGGNKDLEKQLRADAAALVKAEKAAAAKTSGARTPAPARKGGRK